MHTIDVKFGFRLCVLTLIASCTGCDKGPTPSTPTSEPSAGNVVRGQSLLAQYQCGACHVIPNIPVARGIAGPPLNNFGQRSYIAGHIPNNSELLTQWIIDPRSLAPTTTMPSMGVSTKDARDIAAYLHTLR